MIGVLVCTYNGEKYIIEQLESLLSQIKQPDEVIIVDDCSTDIKSEYIFFCDQDDIWDQNKILDLYSLMLENKNVEVSVCSESLYSNGSIKSGKRIYNKNLYFSSDLSIKMLFHNFNGCCMCIKKDFYNKIKLYWNDKRAHDNFFWRFAYVFDSLCVLNKPLVLHRITGENVSRRHSNRMERIIHCDNELNNVNVIEDFLVRNKNCKNREKLVKFNKIKRGIVLRKKFLSSKFLFPYYGLIILIKYRFQYLKIKTFFGDLKTIIFG